MINTENNNKKKEKKRVSFQTNLTDLTNVSLKKLKEFRENLEDEYSSFQNMKYQYKSYSNVHLNKMFESETSTTERTIRDKKNQKRLKAKAFLNKNKLNELEIYFENWKLYSNKKKYKKTIVQENINKIDKNIKKNVLNVLKMLVLKKKKIDSFINRKKLDVNNIFWNWKKKVEKKKNNKFIIRTFQEKTKKTLLDNILFYWKNYVIYYQSKKNLNIKVNDFLDKILFKLLNEAFKKWQIYLNNRRLKYEKYDLNKIKKKRNEKMIIKFFFELKNFVLEKKKIRSFLIKNNSEKYKIFFYNWKNIIEIKKIKENNVKNLLEKINKKFKGNIFFAWINVKNLLKKKRKLNIRANDHLDEVYFKKINKIFTKWKNYFENRKRKRKIIENFINNKQKLIMEKIFSVFKTIFLKKKKRDYYLSQKNLEILNKYFKTLLIYSQKKLKSKENNTILNNYLQNKNRFFTEKVFGAVKRLCFSRVKWLNAVKNQFTLLKLSKKFKKWKMYTYQRKTKKQMKTYYLGVIFKLWLNTIEKEKERLDVLSLNFFYLNRIWPSFRKWKVFYLKKKEKKKKANQIKKKIEDFRIRFYFKALKNAGKNKIDFEKFGDFIPIQISIKEKVLSNKNRTSLLDSKNVRIQIKENKKK